MISLIFCRLCLLCLNDMVDSFGLFEKGQKDKVFLAPYPTCSLRGEARIQRLIPIIYTYKAYIIMMINSAKKKHHYLTHV